jgi:hypothetical protein
VSDDNEQEPTYVAMHELGDFLVTASSMVDTVGRRWWQPWAIRPEREGIGFRGVLLDDPKNRDDVIYAYVLPSITDDILTMAFYVGPYGDPARDELKGVVIP